MATYHLGSDQWPIDQSGRRATYWDMRKGLVYYHTLANFVQVIGHEARSLIDIGSAACRYIEWFDWIPDRVSLDIANPSSAPGVRPIKADFLEWRPDKIYDVVLCSQVLEHVDDAGRFAEKLLSIGKRVLASVPYNWPAGSVGGHVHDPVNQEKMDGWFGREPDHALVVREPFAEERLFCFYDVSRAPTDNQGLNRLLLLMNRPLSKETDR